MLGAIQRLVGGLYDFVGRSCFFVCLRDPDADRDRKCMRLRDSRRGSRGAFFGSIRGPNHELRVPDRGPQSFEVFLACVQFLAAEDNCELLTP